VAKKKLGTRNVVNQQEIKQLIEQYSKKASVDGAKWLQGTFRNWLLNKCEAYSCHTVIKSDPKYIHEAKARGDHLINIRTTDLKFMLDLIVQYMKREKFTDISRIAVADMMKGALAHQKELADIAEKERRALVNKDVIKGTKSVCKFSDGMYAVELTNAKAVKDEAERQHNCLESFARVVEQKRNRLFSIRNANHQSVMSVMYDRYNSSWAFVEVKETCNKDVKQKHFIHIKLLNQKLKASKAVCRDSDYKYFFTAKG